MLERHIDHTGRALAATETGALEIGDSAGIAWLSELSAGAVVCCPVCWISRPDPGLRLTREPARSGLKRCDTLWERKNRI